MNDPRFFTTMAAVGFLVALLFPLLLLSLAIPYAVLRWQDSRNPEQDPQLGMKCVFYFIFSLSVLIVLVGINILAYEALEEMTRLGPMPTKLLTPPRRTALALITAGVSIGVIHVLLILGYTNDLRWPGTRRVFVGYRLAIHALVNLTAFTTLLMQMFLENTRWDDLKLSTSVLVVWGPSWLIHVLLLRYAARLTGKRGRGADLVRDNRTVLSRLGGDSPPIATPVEEPEREERRREGDRDQ